jgi:glucose/arabinose dehydrogenase
MNFSNTSPLLYLYNFVRQVRLPVLAGAIALLFGLVGLFAYSRDLKTGAARTTKPTSATNALHTIPRKTIAAPRTAISLSPPMQAAGPVAAYGFSETSGTTTADASGNSNTGTMVGGVTRITAGKFGNALRFNGSNGVVRVPDSPSWKVNGLTGYTVSLWIKVNSAAGDYKAVIGKGAWPSSDLLINKTGNTWQYNLRTTGLVCGGTTAPVGYLTTVDGTYHHIALVLDTTKGNCQFYSDGAVIGTDEYVSGTTSFATGTGLNDLFIGGLDGGSNFLNADIDEVRLYTRALTLAELQADMTTPIIIGPPDTTPPVLSAATADSITATTATINWTTDEPSDTQVEYGLTTAYGQSTPLAPALTTAHSQVLTSLTPATLYHYRVKSKDAAGNLTTSADFTFTTAVPDTVPPVISAVSSTGITATTATILWTTNEAADSRVEYGTTTAYGSTTTLETNLVTAHSQAVTGLAPATVYHYRVHSKDAAGNAAVSADFTFTTGAATALPGLVAAYGFSEASGTTTADSTGNLNTGTLLGGTTRVLAGKYGQGLAFNGSNAAVRIADSPSWKVSGATGYTISMWIKVKSATGDYKIAVGTGAWPSTNFYIYRIGSAWSFGMRTTGLVCGGTTAPVGYLTTVDGTYHHIALVLDTTKGNCQFYSDGAVIGTDEYVSGTTSFATGTGLNDLFIGGLDGGSNFLNADIDEVRLYTRALTLAELQTDMTTPVDGGPPPDTTPPVLSAVTVNSITATDATIAWTTDEASDTQVEYGLTTAYGQSTTLDAALTTTHTQSLSGLTPGTLYNYRVKSKDAAGNLATSANFTFTTLPPPDTTAPVISSVASNSITQTSAVISWATNEAATSQVEYGTTTAYGSTTTLNPALATSHSHTLSGLTANTLYNFRVLSRDAAGNLATSTNFTFTTAPPPDTTPPVISAVTAGSLTQTSATIAWTTDELATTQIEYGLTTAYENITPLDTTLVLTHGQTLAGLTANTLYHYRVLSRDAAGNLATSADFTFTTLPPPPDTTPPVISAVTAGNLTSTTATITWTTDELSDTQIEYGLTTAYGQATTLDPTMTTTHAQGLSGLTANTLYHYRVKSKDAASNLATSADFTFTTAPPPDTTPPVISSVTAGSITHLTAVITWVTDEAATSQVEYGLTTAYGSSTTLTMALATTHSQTLMNLSPNTLYNYRVLSRDAAGNLATSDNFTFTTGPPPDTTPPVISAVTASNVGTTTATISWMTNEASDTQVEYGLTTAYGQSTTLDAALTTTHTQSLSGLTPGTLYNYRVLSRDISGNLATSANFTFTTATPPDTTPPVISQLTSSSVTDSAAVITWRTNEAATSQVEYGTTTAYGSTTTLNSALATSHSHSLSGLSANTLYHYRVLSRDAAGNLAVSANRTFSTQPSPTLFQDVVWVNGLNQSTAMDFAPDGRLFVAEQAGAVRIIENGLLLPTPFYTVSVNSSGERGLLGLAFDPDFANNHYVYIYYTATTPTIHNRVSRITANGNVAVPGSEVALLDLPTAAGSAHQGGAIHFGNDGKLYIAVGDHVQPETAQSLSSMFGKMLRINSDGTIPTDNPFYAQTTGLHRAIYALGFRNPFTFAVDSVTGRIFVNDVGNNDWEEINQLEAGGNYGWPTCEGPQNTGKGTCTSTSFIYPIHAYSHSVGSAITGGVFYRGAQYPSQYVGDYFFSDYTGSWIRLLDSENQEPGVDNPSSFFRNASPPIDLKVGPDGALYHLLFGGRVSRILYTEGNRLPTAAIVATPALGAAPLIVNLNGTTSSDPDNDFLTYTWAFGDGTPNATGPNVNHTYATAGVYTATLTVNDGRGGQHSTTTQIRVGTAPVATILTPGEGGFYNAGDIIQYSGSGTDLEDGTLPASAFSWTIVFHHDEHTHPFLGPITGVTSGSFQPAQTHETSTNVWYRIHLRVTDSQGLTHEVFRDIRPNVVTLTLGSNIPGATLTLDGQPAVAPITTSSVVGLQRSIGVPSPQTINGNEYVFVSWSNSGAATHTITTPATAATYTATLRPAGPLSTNWLPPKIQVFQNFDLALPLSTTTVAGLEVLLNLKTASVATAPQITVELSWDGGISWTAAQSPPAPTTTEQLFIVGTATDLWGRTGWTASELINTNFRVRITTVSTSPTRDFLLDVAGVRVTAQ